MGGKGKELSLEQKSQIAALFDAGYKKMDIIRLTGIKQSTVYSLLKQYEERGDLENKRRLGRQTEFTYRDSPFVSLQDKVSEKSHLYTAAVQVINKTCLSYYWKLNFLQNSFFSFDEAKMELPQS